MNVELVREITNLAEEIPRMDDKTDLIPKKPPKLAPQGIETFTVCRQYDETGVSGTGVVIEGTMYATGHCVIHWLTLPPRGSFAIFDSFDDFLKIHIFPHPDNSTIITFSTGKQRVYPEPEEIVEVVEVEKEESSA